MLINGEHSERINANDRGLAYGDGLFETLAVVDARPCLWDRHMARLATGCRRLALTCPAPEMLHREASRLIDTTRRGVLKIVVTRGCGGRGYSPPRNAQPTRILQFSTWPEHPVDAAQSGVVVRLCDTRLGCSPALAGLKSLNRLEQVLARSEWEDTGIGEGLMQDTVGHVVEGTMSNLFLWKGGELLTPDLSRCGTLGVMQGLIIDIAAEQSIPVRWADLELEAVRAADGLFLSNSLIAIWPIRQLERTTFDPEALPAQLLAAVRQHAFRA